MTAKFSEIQELKTKTSDYRIATFDMDGTLIDGRVIFSLSEKFGFSVEVKKIQEQELPGYVKTQRIANLLRGIESKEIRLAVASVPLMKNAENTISELKERGFKVGIITDSYTIAAEYLVEKLSLDFFAGNELQLKDDVITGKIKMPLGWDKIGCFCGISVCKRYHLEKNAQEFNIPISNSLAVGDTISDLCMIQRAGLGIAFMPKDELASVAPNIIAKPDLSEILCFVDNSFK